MKTDENNSNRRDDSLAMTLAEFNRRHDSLALILAELEKATRKFPKWATDPLHALAVLGEEFGELTREMLHMAYEPSKTSHEAIRTEALQTAAMAFRLVMSLDLYQYKAQGQHPQHDDFRKKQN